MMTGGQQQGRGRRRRSRRGGQRGQQEAMAPAVETEAQAPEAEAPAEPDEAVEAQQPRERAPRGPADDQQAGRKRGRNRRRSIRRPVLAQMPEKVLRDSVRPVPATEPVATRTLDEFATPTGMTFGCPMLTRTRIGMPFAGGHHVPRCAMGWALHGEAEALLCMRTPDQLDCWKAHPEKEAELRATDEAENAAD
jgi:hypothetical protein